MGGETRMNGFTTACVFAIAAATPSIASAELRTVKFKLTGMDCIYCNGAMDRAIKKLEGVESIELRPEKGTADIRLKADNKITLRDVRRIIKSTGYTPGDAEITARGRIAGAGGTASLDLLNGSTLPIAEGAKESSATIVEVIGVSKVDDKNEERLTITAIK
jgi:copper chaperone CopZ